MVKAILTEVSDIGMQVNRLNSNELVDHCILKFTAETGEVFQTYPLTKGCHASSKLGKIIRTLLKRNLSKEDYVEDKFESDVLIGAEALIEVNNNTIIGVYEAE